MADVFIRREETPKGTHRGKTACDSGGRNWNYVATTKKCQRFLASTRSYDRGKEQSVPWAPRKNQLCQLTSWLCTSSLQNCRRINFCGLSHSVGDALLWQPQDTKIPGVTFFLSWKPVWWWHLPGVINGQDHEPPKSSGGKLHSLPPPQCAGMWKVLNMALNGNGQSNLNISELDLTLLLHNDQPLALLLTCFSSSLGSFFSEVK